MGGALGLRTARCESFGRGLSGAAREQPATVGVGPARTVGGVLWGPRSTRAANGRGVRPLGSGTRLEPPSADRPHLGWAYVVVAVWLPSAGTRLHSTQRAPLYRSRNMDALPLLDIWSVRRAYGALRRPVKLYGRDRRRRLTVHRIRRVCRVLDTVRADPDYT